MANEASLPLGGRQRGAAMVEFAIVIVVFLILVFGGMEFARMLFQWERTVEATRAGVRAAVVSDPPSGCALPLTCPGGNASCSPDDPSEILQAMQFMQPALEASDIEILYECSGTGYPDRPDPIPVVTVRIREGGLVFNPILPGLFGIDASIPIPSFPSSQTGEDLEDTPVS